MGKGGKKKRRPAVVVGPDDPLGKWGAIFYCRREPIFRLVALGPRVAASTPEELRERTAEALIAANKGEKPN
jgi:hypothetical protein